MEKQKTNWKRLIVLFLVAIFGITFLAVAGADVQQVLMKHRWEVGCEGGNYHQCGALGLSLLRDGETYDDMTRGMELMQSTCDQAFPGGCRMAATFGGRRVPTFGGNTMAVLGAHRDVILEQKCMTGDASACFAAAFTLQVGDASSARDIFQRAKELCEAAPDFHSCAAASLLAQALMIDDKTVHEAACRQNSIGACYNWTEDMAPEKTAAVQPVFDAVCKATGTLQLCPNIEDRDRKACWSGSWWACPSVEYDATSEHADVYRAFYGREKRPQPDWVGYAYGDVPGDFMGQCRNGLAEACYLEGVRLVSGYHKAWQPKRPPVAAFQATFGEACSLGMDLGCLAFGIEMLNRPPKAREVKRANTMLDRACGKGNVYACWAKNYEKQLIAGDFSEIKQSSFKACQQDLQPAGACSTYVAILEHELEATPWVMSDRRQAALNVDTCWNGDQAKGCRDRAHVWDLPVMPLGSEMPAEMVFAAFADAEMGCKKKPTAVTRCLRSQTNIGQNILESGSMTFRPGFARRFQTRVIRTRNKKAVVI